MLAPTHKAVYIAAWDAEHEQAAHGDLDHHDPAALKVGKEDFYNGVAHHHNNKQLHDDVAVERRRGYILQHIGGCRAHACADTRKFRCERGLQADAELIEPYGYDVEQIDGKKAFQHVYEHGLNVAATVLRFNGAFKGRDNYAGDVERPGEVAEEHYHALNPR